jgi:hypothetical protein
MGVGEMFFFDMSLQTRRRREWAAVLTIFDTRVPQTRVLMIRTGVD